MYYGQKLSFIQLGSGNCECFSLNSLYDIFLLISKLRIAQSCKSINMSNSIWNSDDRLRVSIISFAISGFFPFPCTSHAITHVKTHKTFIMLSLCRKRYIFEELSLLLSNSEKLDNVCHGEPFISERIAQHRFNMKSLYGYDSSSEKSLSWDCNMLITSEMPRFALSKSSKSQNVFSTKNLKLVV